MSSFCFAEEKSETVKKKLGEVQTFTGRIESILFNSDPMIGNRSQIVLVDREGQEITFVVRTGIGVSAPPADKLGTLKDLKKDDTVIVEYITNKNGINKVMTIELRRY
jgi:hypothetical protein